MLSKFVRSRITETEHRQLLNQSRRRNVTVSDFVRIVVVAHLNDHRAELPHQSRNDAFLRELARIGNNLNQLARQANTGRVPVAEDELRTCIAAVNNLARASD
ncbi:MobC family plasmid mobilization relaxosome protein [Hyphomicrobium sp.]|uniref:MobC family plasmid mobilization relaxosome protein n=1 Tax=Hyphomicrobium sp. TaxID=82 RepID=UPI0025BA4BF7|nr:MobC family plasmid mobilization relaxosome protein [Hyphomicrobium sp.]